MHRETVLSEFRRSRPSLRELPSDLFLALQAAHIHAGRVREFKETLTMAGDRAAELDVRMYLWFKNKKGFSDVQIEDYLKRRR